MDSSNFTDFKDDDKKNFMINFIMPEGLKILESRFKVISNSTIPAFDPVKNGCDDDEKMKIDPKYKSQTTEGDFLLFVGVYNDSSNDTLAYAGSCLLGNFLNLWIKFN